VNFRLISWAVSLGLHAIALTGIWWLSTSLEPPLRIDLVQLELRRGDPTIQGRADKPEQPRKKPATVNPPPVSTPVPAPPPKPPVERQVERPVKKREGPKPAPAPKPRLVPAPEPVPPPVPATARDTPLPEMPAALADDALLNQEEAGVTEKQAFSPQSPGISGSETGRGGSGTTEPPPTAREIYLKEHFTYIRDRVMENVSYPMIARRKGWSGQVVVSFVIFRDGNVDDLRVVSSSGYGILDRCALDAVTRSCPFPPPPTRAEISLPIRFQLQ
jgi:protein TonB